MLNKGDMIGVVAVGDKMSREMKENQQIDKVGKVVVKERKNGSPEWYEDKNYQGDFVLKRELR